MTCPWSATGKAGTKASEELATDVTGSPFVTLTDMAGAFGSRLLTGACGEKYIPLAPESAMPVCRSGVEHCCNLGGSLMESEESA